MEAPVSPAPSKVAAALVTWSPPTGWDFSEYANSGGADPVVAYERASDRITIKIFGAPGSFYKNPAGFMAGPSATTMGRPPVRLGEERVLGQTVTVYRHEYPLPDGDPHATAPRPPRMAREIYCVLPAIPDGRFAVLTYARESPAPDMKGTGDKAWKKFLAGVRRVRKH